MLQEAVYYVMFACAYSGPCYEIYRPVEAGNQSANVCAIMTLAPMLKTPDGYELRHDCRLLPYQGKYTVEKPHPGE